MIGSPGDCIAVRWHVVFVGAVAGARQAMNVAAERWKFGKAVTGAKQTVDFTAPEIMAALGTRQLGTEYHEECPGVYRRTSCLSPPDS